MVYKLFFNKAVKKASQKKKLGTYYPKKELLAKLGLERRHLWKSGSPQSQLSEWLPSVLNF